MDDQKIIPIITFDERVREVHLPMTAGVRREFEGFLRKESERVGQLVRRDQYKALADAESDEGCLRDRLDEVGAALNEARGRRAAFRRSSWTVALGTGVLSLSCFAASVAAEYVLNSAVIPWLLSVPARSWLGMMLSLAPAVAPIILDRVVAALFAVEGGWSGAVAVGSRLGAFAERSLRAAFFVAVAGLTLYTVWLLADSRGVASVLRNGKAILMTAEQHHTVDDALRMVSVALTVNGALFYLFGIHELHVALALRHAGRQIAQLSRGYNEAMAAWATAKAVRKVREREWSDVADLSRIAAEAHVASGMARLEALSAQPAPLFSARDIVAARLSAASARSAARASA